MLPIAQLRSHDAPVLLSGRATPCWLLWQQGARERGPRQGRAVHRLGFALVVLAAGAYAVVLFIATAVSYPAASTTC